jgi:hypothetical protein
MVNKIVVGILNKKRGREDIISLELLSYMGKFFSQIL